MIYLTNAQKQANILDVCCGSKMFWYDKQNEHTIYADIRFDNVTLCDGRRLRVEPDIIADFTKLPFCSKSFEVVIFAPPHLKRAGKTSWLAQKYGVLPKDWELFLAQGFAECFRVLKPFGTLVFKWNSDQIPFSKVIKLAPEPPVFGDRSGKTRWTIFVKGARKNGIK